MKFNVADPERAEQHRKLPAFALRSLHVFAHRGVPFSRRETDSESEIRNSKEAIDLGVGNDPRVIRRKAADLSSVCKFVILHASRAGSPSSFAQERLHVLVRLARD